VYDPEGSGQPDYTAYIDRAFDGDPGTNWLTYVYFQQFPTLKPGVGLALQLQRPVSPASVTVTSPSPGTVFEVRSATGPDVPLAQTQVLGTGTVTGPDPVTVPLTAAPPSQYLIVFITQLEGSGRQWQSRISEISVSAS
jgi:putative peptidoglycan lipid II flippase